MLDRDMFYKRLNKEKSPVCRLLLCIEQSLDAFDEKYKNDKQTDSLWCKNIRIYADHLLEELQELQENSHQGITKVTVFSFEEKILELYAAIMMNSNPEFDRLFEKTLGKTISEKELLAIEAKIKMGDFRSKGEKLASELKKAPPVKKKK